MKLIQLHLTEYNQTFQSKNLYDKQEALIAALTFQGIYNDAKKFS